MKYDPSKYCHNIKKLDEGPLEAIPVSQLTWRLEGGDDEMSRKRRGEFPVENKPKVQRLPGTENPSETGKCIKRTRCGLVSDASGERQTRCLSGLKEEVSGLSVKRSRNRMFESDSEDELKAILEIEKKAQNRSPVLVEDSNLEVVEESFELRYNTHWGRKDAKVSGKNPANHNGNAKDDREYDSADTDEIIAVAKTVQKEKGADAEHKAQTSGTEMPSLKPKKQENNLVSADIDGTEVDLDLESDDDDSGADSSSSDSDEDYESMMQNCYRIDLTLEDLEKLAKAAKGSSEDDTVDEETADDQGKIVGSSKERTPVSTQKKKPGIAPEDIVASILEDDDSCDEQPNGKRKKVPPVTLPAFKGLGSLLGTAPSEEQEGSISAVFSRSGAPAAAKRNTSGKVGTRNAEISRQSRRKETLESDSGGECDSKPAQQHRLEAPCLPITHREKELDSSKRQPCSSSSSDTSSDESSSDTGSSDESAGSPAAPCNAVLGTSFHGERAARRAQPSAGTKQLKDNEKRLAAMEERRKERELQKQTIQGALLKDVSEPASKGRHIVFSSETESEEEAKTSETPTGSDLAQKWRKERQAQLSLKALVKNVTTQLFESSEETDDDGEREDGERFKIRSQYEGRSGEKLMHLQSRFGTDERFRMDSRFLDSSDEEGKGTPQPSKAPTGTPQAGEEEDDLSAEKKKNLGILQSLLHISVEPRPLSKHAAKAKKFKDLNALQYDPTREDHAAFETKAEEEKKDSKSERKKKRLEAEKLPTVSAETYHEVAADFKEAFGGSKLAPGSEEAGAAWDQEEEPAEDCATQNDFCHRKEETSGFTFSFFGASTEKSVSEEPYKTEPIKPAKVAWQEDPRFQDSSSEGEDEEETLLGVESQTSVQSASVKNCVRFFFFVKDDERLKAGPKLFFRSSNLEEEQEAWEHRRGLLLEECRKRHKDAKRKVKAKH
ncbi:nucleolar protein 8 isoform X1 [Ascaphus truei]|uniref:nucleolar protein 8 isoform X1 n=1 Tax=Ascaphus truei TaxID=8439 RepID=UPI003F59056C